MWGCDLTPLYDETGSRLMSFTAFLPLGMRLSQLPRPADVPSADADLVMVEEVLDQNLECVSFSFFEAISMMGSTQVNAPSSLSKTEVVD